MTICGCVTGQMCATHLAMIREGERERAKTDREERLIAAVERTAPRWIPVSERLPEPGVRVLVYRPDCELAIMEMVPGEQAGDDDWIYPDGADATPPSHWMLLPAPPTS